MQGICRNMQEQNMQIRNMQNMCKNLIYASLVLHICAYFV